jgi:hypothetical protein
MSFYSSLLIYRPDVPRKVSRADLAAFISAFALLGLKDETGAIDYYIKFGRGIDQDVETLESSEPIFGDGLIRVWDRPSYDADGLDFATLALVPEDVKSLTGTIYRADLSLGYASKTLFDHLGHEPSEDNELGLALGCWGLELGPILSYGLNSEVPYKVGWLEVKLHRHGYLYPWSFRELIDRAESFSSIRALMELCCRTWPIAPGKPPRHAAKARKAMGDLWPYPRTDQPWACCWGLQESG